MTTHLHIANCSVTFKSVPEYGVYVYAEGNGEDLEFLDVVFNNCPVVAPYFATSSLRYSHAIIPESSLPTLMVFINNFLS